MELTITMIAALIAAAFWLGRPKVVPARVRARRKNR